MYGLGVLRDVWCSLKWVSADKLSGLVHFCLIGKHPLFIPDQSCVCSRSKIVSASVDVKHAHAPAMLLATIMRPIYQRVRLTSFVNGVVIVSTEETWPLSNCRLMCLGRTNSDNRQRWRLPGGGNNAPSVWISRSINAPDLVPTNGIVSVSIRVKLSS